MTPPRVDTALATSPPVVMPVDIQHREAPGAIGRDQRARASVRQP